MASGALAAAPALALLAASLLVAGILVDRVLPDLMAVVEAVAEGEPDWSLLDRLQRDLADLEEAALRGAVEALNGTPVYVGGERLVLNETQLRLFCWSLYAVDPGLALNLTPCRDVITSEGLAG
ncbi:hypothetical protein [Pyrodictium abyssi]|uniref:Uncharacterized protein n=1 Tax=Pyrodictium abyssi TaxID=54256 RepID=A0ABM8IUD4_9CREN|nr:hypothetical protein PABY_06960 [Pyrodictium abyssi]